MVRMRGKRTPLAFPFIELIRRHHGARIGKKTGHMNGAALLLSHDIWSVHRMLSPLLNVQP